MSLSSRRTAAAAAVAGVAVVALAACSSGSNSSSPSDDAAASGSPVTITYLHRLPDGEGMTAVADIVAKWNADHSDIQVKPTKFDGEAAEMQVKLATDVKAGNAPCLAQVGYSEVPELYAKGLLEDVTKSAKNYNSDFSQGANALMTVGGVQVGLPQDTGPLVYFYNATEFDKLGLAVPTTLDQFKTEAQTAAAAGKYIADFQSDEAPFWLSAQAAAAGSAWFTPTDNAWQVNANDAGSKVVADLWQSMIDAKTTLVQPRWGDGFTQALTDGSLIGHIGAAWEAGFLLDPLDGTPAEGQWRVAQLPDYGAGQVTGPDGGSGVAVMKGCKYPEQAMEFNAWFNTQTNDLATQGLVPAANAPVTTPEKMSRQFGGQDVMAELATATANLSPTFVYAPGFSAMSAISKVADNVGTGTAKMSDVFDTAQSTAVAAIESLGLPVAN